MRGSVLGNNSPKQILPVQFQRITGNAWLPSMGEKGALVFLHKLYIVL